MVLYDQVRQKMTKNETNWHHSKRNDQKKRYKRMNHFNKEMKRIQVTIK